MLARLPSLGVVGVAGLSLHRHGADRLLDRGIALVNASHAYAESVAEFALGLAILGRRRAFVTDLVMRGGGWGATPKSHGWRAAVVSVERTVRSIASRAGLETPLLKAWRSFVPRSGLAPVQASGPRELRGRQRRGLRSTSVCRGRDGARMV
jgi:hypothetical protein